MRKGSFCFGLIVNFRQFSKLSLNTPKKGTPLKKERVGSYMLFHFKRIFVEVLNSYFYGLTCTIDNNF